MDSIVKSLPLKIDSRNDFQTIQHLKSFLSANHANKGPYKYDLLISFIEESEKWCNANGTFRDVLSSRLLKLMLFDKLQWQEQTLKLGNQLLENEEFYSSEDVSKISGILYNNYKQLEAYDEIIKLFPLLEKYQNMEDGWRIKGFTSEYDLAMINYKAENYRPAATGYLNQMKTFDSIGNQLMVSSMYNNAALCYYQLGDCKTAMKYYNIALIELSKPNNKNIKERPIAYINCFEMIIKGNIADIAFKQGKFDQALQVYKKEYEACISEAGYPTKTAALYNLAKTYLVLKKPDQAITYIDSTLNSINSFVTNEKRIKSLELKGKILLFAGNTEESFHYFKKVDKLRDSVQKLQIEQDNIVARVKYENKKKENNLRKIKADLLIEEKITTQLWYFLGVLIPILIMMAYLYYKSRKDKKTIEIQREKLQASVKEKEILLKEVHHRVKNNLQVISGLLQLQSNKVRNKKWVKLLDESQYYISSIASVHEMLYRQEESSTINMENYINKLSTQLLSTTNGSEIATSISTSQIDLPMNKAIPLGLIVCELVTNTLKYAFKKNKGNIIISLTKDKEQYIFKYQDSGKGLPYNFESNISKTMGFRLIQMLSEEMHGTAIINGKGGVSVTVLFKSQ